MSRAGAGEDGRRLSRPWRRGLVLVMAVGATGVIILGASERRSESGFLLGSLVGGCICLIALWLLADSMRPWLVRGIGAGGEERAHADATLRNSYRVIAAAAIIIALYLQIAEALAGRLATDPARASLLLWSFIVLVIVLPVLIAAWTEPADGFGAGTVGPAGLIRARFRGSSAPAYIAAAVLFSAGLLLLVTGAVKAHGGSQFWLAGAIIAAILVILVVAGLFTWNLFTERADRRL